MKKYFTGFTASLIGLGLVIFTPDYHKSVGGTEYVTCSENDLLGGCKDGLREVAWDGVETNYLYLALYFIGTALFVIGFVYLVSLILKKILRKSS